MDSQCPKPTVELLETMPTDNDIDFLYQTYAIPKTRDDGAPEWGVNPVWNEFHTPTRYPYSNDY